MNNIASDLLLLTTNLSQFKSKERIIQIFIESLNDIFSKHSFNWYSENKKEPESCAPVCTLKKTYGYIQFEEKLKSDYELYTHFQNATQLVAILLERLEQETLLKDQKAHLQYLVDEQTSHLIQKQDELNEMNEEFSILNEELITTNKTLFKLNELLQSQITERKQAEEKLWESESQFRKIYENGPLGMAFADKDGYFLMANNTFCQIIGYKEYELKGLTFKDITHPDHLSTDTINVKKLIKGDIPFYKTEKRYIRKDNQVIWASLTATANYTDSGEFLFLVAMIEEITDRKLAEEVIRESEQLFSNIFYKSPVSITITSRDESKIIDVNDIFLRDLEYNREDVIGKSITELGIFYDLRIRDKLIDSLKENGSIFGFECPFLTKTGKLVLGLVSMSFIRYKGKTHQLTMVIDITERKQSEIKLRESERLLNESQRVSGIGSYTLDIFKGIWTGSKFLNEMFEIDASDDHSVEGWISLVLPEDREMMYKYFINDVIGAKGRFDKEYRIVPKNKRQEKWVHGYGELEFDMDGKPVKMIGTVQDITERKKADEELRKLSRAIEQSPNLVIITDTDGIIEYANPAILKMTGYKSEELIGKSKKILSSGKLTKVEYTKIWNTKNSGNIWQGEFRTKMKNGELFWQSATISPILDNSGKIVHFLAIGEDITEKKKLTFELIEAKERAEESDRLKSSFLSNMSHEIRTPMNSIMGFASLLPDEESKDLMSQYAQIIVQNSEQLVSIIDGIIMYSKLQTRLFAYHPTLFNVQKLFTDLQQSFNLPEYQKGVCLRIDIDSDNEILINTDYDKIRQIFTNLVSNAFKYTNNGEITIGCTSNAKIIEFCVNDTGIGIPDKEKQQVFERFYRGSNVNQSVVRGTGLGLSIVKELVELLGGKIWIESKIGVGSSFYFIIPKEL